MFPVLHGLRPFKSFSLDFIKKKKKKIQLSTIRVHHIHLCHVQIQEHVKQNHTDTRTIQEESVRNNQDPSHVFVISGDGKKERKWK